MPVMKDKKWMKIYTENVTALPNKHITITRKYQFNKTGTKKLTGKSCKLFVGGAAEGT